jgi:thiamine-phosphate pyrophosphorylase
LRNSRKTEEPFFPIKRPLYYYVTGRKSWTGPSILECIHRNIVRGVDFIQIREKDLSDRALFVLACDAVALAGNRGCRILINGRADIALAAGAAGVHLPSSGLRVEELKRAVPSGFLIGVSAHSLKEARCAAGAGAHYVLLGPIYCTESKAPLGSPLGLKLLRRACSIVPVPIIAIGGLSLANTDVVLNAGAAGIAGISMFQR